jgi:KDO2-lipid IV(A) lauroyltransferase
MSEVATAPAAQQRTPHDLLSELRDWAIHYGLRMLTTEACSNLGARLGRTMGRNTHPVAASRAQTLLAQLHPDLDEAALAAAGMRLWENIGRTFAEFSVLHRMLPEGRSTLSNPGLLDALYADDRPLILCFVHLGNWEVLGAQISTHARIRSGRPFVALVESPKNRAHAFISRHQRRALPVDFLAMNPRVWHRVGETLRRPGGIAWLAADEAANRRVYAPHFGRRLRSDGNLGKIVRLAAATGALVVPMYSRRTGGARFVAHLEAPMEFPRGRLAPEALLDQVARLDAVFAPIVRRLADQWYMASEFRFEADDPVRV